MKAWVEHGYYGCDTGCCGHRVVTDAPEHDDVWAGFDHPYGEDPRAFAESMVREVAQERKWGPVEFDWEACRVSDD